MISQSNINKKILIFNAALDLFVQNDIDKTSTLSIAKKAGVSNGTLFHYFPSKNDLIIELYLNLKTEMFEYIYSGNIMQTGKLKDMIEKGWKNAVQWTSLNQVKYTYIQKIYKSVYHQLINEENFPDNYLHYLNIIKTGIGNKELRDIPVELMVSIINNHVSALAEYYTQKSNNSDESLNNKIFEMTWDCIKT